MNSKTRTVDICNRYLPSKYAGILLFLIAGGILLVGPSVRAETVYGMPVVKTLNGYKIVDIRPILKNLTYENDRAKKEFRATTAMAVCDVSNLRWEKADSQTASGIPIQEGTIQFKFKPSRSSSMFVGGAMYYKNGRWVAVHAGASRKNEYNSMFDTGDGNYSPAGFLFSNWCSAWSQTLPTVCILIDYYGSFMSYGILLNKETTPYPSAPSNTYRLIHANLTWTQAKSDAQKRGGTLATITSPAEWAQIVSQIGQTIYGKDIWIGATDEGSEGNWRWITGESFDYANWKVGQPNNVGSRQHYGRIWGTYSADAQWDDNDNASQPYYLLEIEGQSAPAPAYPTPPSNTYSLVSGSFTWSQAKADAEARGGYLATITSPAEWQNIVAQIGTDIYNKDCWIGATDKDAEGVWRWITGETWNYARWSVGQPNNIKSIQHYGRVWGSTGTQALWDDDADASPQPYYILEKNGTSPTPNPSYTSVYTLVSGNFTWTEANADAAQRGGHLATIQSAAEWTEILRQQGSNLAGKNFWFGATDEGSEGNWRWANGEPWNYSNWMIGQPNNIRDRQHYGHIDLNVGSQWDDMENAALSYYLLETLQPVASVAAVGSVSTRSSSASTSVATTEPVRQRLVPDGVLTSDGTDSDVSGWNAVDGDIDTAWTGDSGVEGGWIALTYDDEVCVESLDLLLGEGSLTNILYLGSVNAREWFDIGQAMAVGPAGLHYLWIIFEPDASGSIPIVNEIQINEP